MGEDRRSGEVFVGERGGDSGWFGGGEEKGTLG